MSQFTLIPEQSGDTGLAATLIARTYMSVGAKMIEVTGQLKSLPEHEEELGVLVSDEDKAAVGYALFTPVKVGETEKAALLLAPLAYDTMRQDVDADIILEEVLKHAQSKGYRYVIMHGDAEAYQSLGFDDAEDHGVTSDVRYPNSMLLLKDFGKGKPEAITGKVDYPDFITKLA